MKLIGRILLPFLFLATATGLLADSWTEGGKDMLILDCYYSDTAPTSLTTQQVNDLFKIGQSGGIDEWLRRDSFGRAWYNSVTHVKVQLPGTKESYSGAGFSAYQDGLAASGENVNDYDRVMTLASGTVVSSTAYAFIRGKRSHYNGLPNKTIAHHELHHNMGLNHANRWETGTAPRAASGGSVEYGDGDDIMGGGGTWINAQYKRRLDYLKEANGELVEAVSGTTYRIFDHTYSDLTPAGTALRGVRVPIEGNNLGGDRQLWISYTYNLGDAEMRGGVQIHSSRQNTDSYSHRLDMSPGDHLSDDSSAAVADIRSSELAIGQTYTDVQTTKDYSHPGKISITPIGKGTTNGVNWMDVTVYSESVGANTAPTGGAISGAATANTGQPIALTASATDSNGDTLAYYWDFDDGTFSTDNAAVQNKSWSQPGYYQVSVTISDRRGGSTTAEHWVNVGSQTSRAAENDATTGELNYTYYEGIFTVLPNFEQLLPVSSGTIATVDIPSVARGDNFAVEISGYLDVPTTDIYRFVLRSEDGSRLYIGDTLVVDNSGNRNSPEEVSANIALDAGQHAITVQMHHSSGNETLQLSWATLGQAPSEITASDLAGRDWQSNGIPTVSITNPTDGGSVDFGTTPTFAATASDADGIAKVQFYLNGSYLGEDSSAPYELPWSASFAGTFDLTALAIDNTGRSASVTNSFSVTTPAANQVGINFVGSASYNTNTTWPLNPGESAGAVYLNDHWNNFTGSTASTNVSLTDQDGTASPIRVSQWSGLAFSGGGYTYPNPEFFSLANTSTANGKLLKGLNWRRHDQSAGSQPAMTFSNIPYQEYEVYVYFDYNETKSADATVLEFELTSNDANQASPASIFGRNSVTVNDGLGDYPTYDTWTNFKEATGSSASSPNSVLLGNYVVFRGQYTHSFKLLVDSAGERYVNAMQVVEVPPTIPRVHIVGGAATVSSSEVGEPFSYQAVLTMQPTAPVAVSIDVPEGLELDTYLLYFTPSNWNIPQTVTVYPQDNNTLDGNLTVNIVHNPSGGNYASAPDTLLPVELTDDETAAVTVDVSNSVVTEVGASSTDFRVFRVGGQLGNPLTVNFSMSGTAAADGADYSISGTGVTYNTGTATGTVIIPANTAFSPVTLTPVNDATVEGIERATLTLTSGSAYAVGDPAAVNVDIGDTGTGIEFTEVFAANSFDLNGKTITFTPDGSGAFYSAEVTSTTVFHTSSSGHADVYTSGNFEDDRSYVTNQPSVFFGQSYTQLWLGSNGYITFTQADTEHIETPSAHFNLPRISMFFTDMVMDAGTTTMKAGRSGSGADARTVVTVVALREYNSSPRIDYQAELFDDGRLRLTWLNASVNDTALVGLSSGIGGANGFTSVDLSALTPIPALPNNAPFFASTAKTSAIQNEAYSLEVLADDLDGDTLALTAPTKPAWLTLTGTGNGTAILSGTPTSAGSYPVVLEVDDGTAAPVQQSFTIVVSDPLVDSPPSIIEQPAAQSVSYNEDVSFRVVASGTPTLTYQWYLGDLELVDNGHFSGTTSEVLQIDNATDGDTGNYYCVITNAYGSATSDPAALSVGAPTAPSFVTQPTDQTVNVGTAASFTVAVDGTGPLSYRWQKDGVDITNGGSYGGATTPTLTISNAQLANEGNYRVFVSNSAASDVASDQAILAINNAPAVTVDSPVGSAANIVNISDRLVLETTVTDDGKPASPGATTVTWSQVNGPGTATFEDPIAADTTVSFSQAGDYVLRVSASDGLSATTEDITVTVSPAGGSSGQLVRYNFGNGNTDVSPTSTDIQVNATNITLHGLNQESQSGVLALTAINGTLADYVKFTITPAGSGSSIDLNGATVSYSWQRVQQGGSTRVDLISGGTTVTLPVQSGSSSGTSNYSEAVSGLPVSGSVEIRIYLQANATWNDIDLDNLTVNGAIVLNTGPVTNAGADATADAGIATALAGSATDDGKPNPPGAVSYQWTQISGPGTAVFATATSPTTDVTFPVAGSYTLRLIAGDSAIKTADDVTYTVTGGSPLTHAEQWRDQYFNQTANTGDAADGNDHDDGGSVNLLERAFGTDPTDGADDYKPTLGTTDVSGSEHLTITYRRLIGGTGTTGVNYTVDGMTYTVEYDGDLSPPWSSGAVTQVGNVVDNLDGTETVTVRLNSSMSGDEAYFIRLKVNAVP